MKDLLKTTPLSPAEEADPEIFARAHGFAEAPTTYASLYLIKEHADPRLFEWYLRRRRFSGPDRWYAAASYIREWKYNLDVQG